MPDGYTADVLGLFHITVSKEVDLVMWIEIEKTSSECWFSERKCLIDARHQRRDCFELKKGKSD